MIPLTNHRSRLRSQREVVKLLSRYVCMYYIYIYLFIYLVIYLYIHIYIYIVYMHMYLHPIFLVIPFPMTQVSYKARAHQDGFKRSA